MKRQLRRPDGATTTLSRAGIRDVARLAGVSTGTVSNALNRPEIVADRTRQRIASAIAELGFVRNDLARQLKAGDSRTLGMQVLDVANPFFADLAHACELAAETVGLTVTLGSSNADVEREDRYLELFTTQQVGGLLIAPVTGATERMRGLHRDGVPMVLFDGRADPATFCSVALDGRAGGAMAMRHLVLSGRRRVVFAAGDSYLLEDRWDGASAVAEEHRGVELTRRPTVDQSVAAGHALGAEIARLPSHRRPDAILAGTDQIAIGILQALVLDPAVDVPGDIAVVGYDDIVYAASAIIPLTTVRQPLAEIAAASLRLLVAEQHDADHPHQRILLDPELVIRASAP